MTGRATPSLAELLATWQAWSSTNTLIQAIARAQTSGDAEAAEALAQHLPGEPEVDALSALAANHDLVRLLTGWQWHAIRDAREHGATWDQIGTVLGLPAEQAQAQYRRSIEQAERYAAQYTDTARYRAVLDDPAPESGSR